MNVANTLIHVSMRDWGGKPQESFQIQDIDSLIGLAGISGKQNGLASW
jgi:hypothetical protein